MPLLKAETKEKLISVPTKIPESLKQEADAYMEFVGIKSMNSFVNQAIKHVLTSDKDWKKFKANK